MSKKILVVDDEPDVVTYFTALLEENGYETRSASNGTEAMAAIDADRPDLITLDITMPEQSGVKTYRRIKESDSLKTIPVIIITGVASDFKRFISTRSQVPAPDGYLEKPIQPQTLLDEVARLLS
ncbi:MAG: response regulator [Deltaproteobacteria bacterium]|nr:response regulator [Deltaproteobacteria bacterium]